MKDNGNSEECDKMVESLLEMFPTLCTMEITHCLSLSNGDPEEAVQLILHRQETGDSIKPSPTKVKYLIQDTDKSCNIPSLSPQNSEITHCLSLSNGTV